MYLKPETQGKPPCKIKSLSKSGEIQPLDGLFGLKGVAGDLRGEKRIAWTRWNTAGREYFAVVKHDLDESVNLRRG